MVVVEYVNIIDTHVHLRETGGHFAILAIEDMQAVGVDATIEQPNPPEALTTPEAIQRRDEFYGPIFKKAGIKKKIHIGMTTNMEQNRISLQAVIDGKYGLVSDKTFNSHSTGNMGILDPEMRRAIMFLKAEMGYKAVSLFHPEDATKYTGEFDPERPETHSIRQNEYAEVASVEETYRNAVDAGFGGILDFCHLSSPDSIDFLNSVKGKGPKSIIEVVLHHMELNAEDDYPLHGLEGKMNPPLRSRRSQRAVRARVIRGDVDLISTDHAPHKRKSIEYPASGVKGELFWPFAIDNLRKDGIEESLLQNMIHYNANEIFQFGLEPRKVSVDLDEIRSMWDRYEKGSNVWTRVDGTI